MDYVDGLKDDCRVLLFDYPLELRTNPMLPKALPPPACGGNPARLSARPERARVAQR